MPFFMRLLVSASLAFMAFSSYASSNTFRFIVLSDTHVGKNDDSYKARYEQMVREITNSQPKPAAVFATGDLTELGRESEYEHYNAWFVKPLQAAGISLYSLPGNHEIGTNLLSVYPAKLGPVRQAVDIQQTRFILTCGVPDNFMGGHGSKAVPSLQAGMGQGGFMDAEQLAWIRQALEAPESRNARITIMMNHFPLWNEDFGGYAIQDYDFLGHPSKAGSVLREWMDQYGVDLFLCGHRHFQAAPVTHTYPGGHRTLHVLSESSVMGARWRLPDEKGKVATRGGFGYEVYDVEGSRISHYRKIIDTAGFAVVGPTNVFSFTASGPRPLAAPAALPKKEQTLSKGNPEE